MPSLFNTNLNEKGREGNGKEPKGCYKFINSGQAVAVLLFTDY